MAGLVAYESSDEEDEASQEVATPVESQLATSSAEAKYNSQDTAAIAPQSNGHPTSTKHAAAVVGANDAAPLQGPALGPTLPTTSDEMMPLPEADDDASAPQSPYTANRALVRELTLPSMPNLEIPPSPPRSPPPTTNAKFAHFLKLKKKGVHFNERLATSSALKNPSLMQKLMDFAEIGEENEYNTSLPTDLWDPKSFPAWAYKEELAASQQNMQKQREAEKKTRTTMEFVPSASTESRSNSTPSGAKVAPQSAAERIMAGLDRGTTSGPQIQAGMKRKTRFDG